MSGYSPSHNQPLASVECDSPGTAMGGTLRAAGHAEDTRNLSSVRFSRRLVLPLLLIVLVLLRLPTTLLTHELNLDESNMLGQAMKLAADPRPWIAVDPTSVGPLDAFLLVPFLLIGVKPGFVFVHVMASVLVCLQVVVAYFTLRRLKSAATFGAALMVLFYGLTSRPDYLHYAGELLPTLLLMLGFYMFIVWLQRPATPNGGVRGWLLFSAGLVAGAGPWGKLQAAPVTLTLGLLIFAAIFFARGPAVSLLRRVGEAAVFSVGAVAVTVGMFALLVHTGALTDFWNSYILTNLSYSGPASVSRIFVYAALSYVVTPLNQYFVVGMALLVCVIWFPYRDPLASEAKENKWITGGLLAYTGASVLGVCRVRYLFPHHVIFLVPPTTYLLAFLAEKAWGGMKNLWDSRTSYVNRAIILVALSIIPAFSIAYVTRYVYMLKAIRQIPGQPGPEIPAYRDRSEAILDVCIGPSQWVLPDSNERISAVIRRLQGTYAIHSLMIWGWAPGVYVITGMPPVTRDLVPQIQIKGGPLRDYYEARFVGDLKAHPPDLFVDAVGRGMLAFNFTEEDGYEVSPKMRKFIDDNYVLVEKLPVIKGSKPVRFFVRRELVTVADNGKN